VERVNPDRWIDYHTENIFTTDQIIELYGDQLPQKLFDTHKLPEWLQAAIASVDTHLVETQRLRNIGKSPGSQAVAR
jgi:hypothetical protein